MRLIDLAMNFFYICEWFLKFKGHAPFIWRLRSVSTVTGRKNVDIKRVFWTNNWAHGSLCMRAHATRAFRLFVRSLHPRSRTIQRYLLVRDVHVPRNCALTCQSSVTAPLMSLQLCNYTVLQVVRRGSPRTAGTTGTHSKRQDEATNFSSHSSPLRLPIFKDFIFQFALFPSIWDVWPSF